MFCRRASRGVPSREAARLNRTNKTPPLLWQSSFHRIAFNIPNGVSQPSVVIDVPHPVAFRPHGVPFPAALVHPSQLADRTSADGLHRRDYPLVPMSVSHDHHVDMVTHNRKGANHVAGRTNDFSNCVGRIERGVTVQDDYVIFQFLAGLGLPFTQRFGPRLNFASAEMDRPQALQPRLPRFLRPGASRGVRKPPAIAGPAEMPSDNHRRFPPETGRKATRLNAASPGFAAAVLPPRFARCFGTQKGAPG